MDRPIIFSAPMIQALLAGRKTQTRRILKPYDGPIGPGVTMAHGPHPDHPESPDFARIITAKFKPRYAVGDRLYVREAHYLTDDGDHEFAVFAADHDAVRDHLATMDRIAPTLSPEIVERHKKLRPSIHMPRWASRLTLLVTDVRAQRLQDISEEDAEAEGARSAFGEWFDAGFCQVPADGVPFVTLFSGLWSQIHGDGAWTENPWVVAVSFTVQHGNIDALPVTP